MRTLLASVVALLLIAWPAGASAQPPDADVLSRLATFAASFEAMKTRASFQADGRLEIVGSDGKGSDVKEGRLRVVGDGETTHVEIVSYFEDGQDKTAEAKQKAADKAKEPKKEGEGEAKREFRMPFHAAEQPRYVFDQVEQNATDPNLVRITFVPKIREEDSIEGDAWVNKSTGAVVSAGFRLANPPGVLDYLNVTVRFGNATSLGPAISDVSVDGKAGILFLHKRFRGHVSLSQVTIAP